MGDEGGDSASYGDPYGALGKDWWDIANRAPTLLTPEDWYNWGKGQPGFFGTYHDPQSGQTRPTPPPPSLVPSGVSQNYNPASGRWDIHDDRSGGFLGFVEEDPYRFAALAAAALAGGVAAAPAAATVGAGEVAAEGGAAAAGGGGGLFGTGVTGSQALQALQLANATRNLAQNPSGTSAGGLLGSAASAYTGIPGLGTAGSFAGGTAQNTLEGSAGGDTLQDRGGGQRMAESTGDTSAMDWINALGPLLTSGAGLAGSGLTLAAMPEVLKRLETLYNQSQGNFQQQTQYAQLYQALLQHYQQQQQQQFQTETGQSAEDRAARQQAYLAQTGERALDRSNIATANQGRAALAGRLSDPTQVAAGAQQLYQPMSTAMTDNLLRGVQRDLAMRGQSDGGAASRATADAMAPYYNQLQQQAMQSFLASQGQALSAYNPLTGPYTQDAPQGPYAPRPPQPPQPAQLPNPSQYVPGSNVGPQANQAGAYQGLSNQVAQLGKLLFGNQANSPGAVALLSKLVGDGQGGNQPDAGTSTEFLGQQYNQDFMNSFGADTGGGAGNFDYSSIDPAYYDFG